MKFESKKQMAKELMDGKKFIDDSGLEIYYDERYPNPFRCSAEEMSGIWHMYDRDIWMEVDNQRHVHQDLMDSYQDGQSWQYRVDDNTDWVNLFTQFACHQPAWYDDTQYRLHPHNELIQAHRNGAKIQAYICGDWVEESNPDWYEDTQYRIKPATKVVYEWMLKSKFSPKWMIEVLLMSEDEAKDYFSEHEYQKTGRSWEVEE